MYLVVWFDSGWSEVIVRQMENREAAEELLTECEDNMDCIDPKIIVLCPW